MGASNLPRNIIVYENLCVHCDIFSIYPIFPPTDSFLTNVTVGRFLPISNKTY